MVSTTLTLTLLFQTLLLLAAVVTANPLRRMHMSPVTLPIARRVNLTSVHNLVRHDQARAKALRARKATANSNSKTAAEAAVGNVPVDNQAVTYVASVGFGSPPTYYSLIIDTGSSNTWTGAQTLSKSYKLTNADKLEGNAVSVTYGSGSFAGLEYIDTVTLASDLVIPNQSIGGAVLSRGFNGVDGILGIGPTDLTVGTLIPAVDTPIPTVTDNLYNSGTIPANQIGIYFQPITDTTLNGEMSFGGIDTTKTTSDITWIPVTSTSPSSLYWGIDQSITYGLASTPILPSGSGIVDTGTTLIYIASDAFAAYQAVTGGVADDTTGLLRITNDQYENLESLYFLAGGTTFELTPNAQIWPRILNTDIGGDRDAVYLIVGNIGTKSGSGLDFINGYSFLERYYSVFDTGGKRVGLASTAFTDLEVN